MLNHLHDLRNKLTIISGHTAILANKYGEEDFFPIRTNLTRINDIINDAYQELKNREVERNVFYNIDEFIRQMDLLTETVELLFPIQLINEVRSFKAQSPFQVELNIRLVFQTIENALDNSLKANSTKLIIRLFETSSHCVFEIVDNGVGKNTEIVTESDNFSNIPHGIGKEIMMQNMQMMKGKVEWTRRVDFAGMIVRLYFPKQ